jgi:hypothetical protein
MLNPPKETMHSVVSLFRKDAVSQTGASSFPDKIQISTEGLTIEEIAAGHTNVGISPKLLDAFNKAILSVKEVK